MIAALALSALVIDPVKSTAKFSVSHIWVDRVTGTVPIVSGTIEVSPNSSVPTSVSAVLDATHIVTDDPDRNKALESPDFFDAAKFPTWTFTSTKIVANAHGFTMDGDLTIHGVTAPEELDVTVSGTPDHPVYNAVGKIDRRAFAMKKTQLDPVIGDVVDITLEIRVR